MQVAPFVAHSPDGIRVVIENCLAVQVLRLTIHMGADAKRALVEAAKGEVDVEQRTVAGDAAIFLQPYQALLPGHQRIQDVHVLAVARRLAIVGLAMFVHTGSRPYGMHLAAHGIYETSWGRSGHLVHLLVGHIRCQVSVDGASYEMHTYGRIGIGIAVGEIGDIGKAFPLQIVIDDVDAVLQTDRLTHA